MTESQTKIEPYILESLSDNVQWLTLNRPKQRNPLSSHMIAALKGSIETASNNPEVRSIVIASSGPVFSAGHDLKEMSFHEGESRAEHRARLEQILVDCSQMMLCILHSPKAVIAKVHATATAAGCQLVSACDLAIASEAAKFCTPGVNIGGFCTTPLVVVGRNIHRKHAMELALTGDMFSAEDAVRFGLINRAVPLEELHAETEKLARKIAAGSARGIRSGKEVFYRQVDMPIEQAFEYANQAMLDTMSSPESDEGISAFLEKRDPQWGGA